MTGALEALDGQRKKKVTLRRTRRNDVLCLEIHETLVGFGMTARYTLGGCHLREGGLSGDHWGNPGVRARRMSVFFVCLRLVSDVTNMSVSRRGCRWTTTKSAVPTSIVLLTVGVTSTSD